MVFDITLPQLMLVFAVGAATLGPRDLPRAARSAGYLVGRAARYMRDSASTANQLLAEAEIPELKQEIQQSMKDMERIRSQIQRATSFSGLQSAAAQAASPPQSSAAPPSPSSFASAPVGKAAARSNPQGGPGEAVAGAVPSTDPPAEIAPGQQLNLSQAPGGMASLERELLSHDATASRPAAKQTITEELPSGADVVVECLTQQRFNRDVRDFLKKNE
mmetsp:Transcript_16984/g.34727  ORF Transcript_16984/g.34727 Transcript_16984/m.34727 type:complete len:219 (+) Transcript_16984:163-819(+)